MTSSPECSTKSADLFVKSVGFLFDHIGVYVGCLSVFFIPYFAYKFGFFSSEALNEYLAVMTSYEAVNVLRNLFQVFFCLLFVIYNIALLFVTDILSQGGRVNVWACFGRAVLKLPLFIGLFLNMAIRVLLWGLLLIVPGVVKLLHYIIAPVYCLVKGYTFNDSLRLSDELIRSNRKVFLMSLILGAMFVFAMTYSVNSFLQSLVVYFIIRRLEAVAVGLDFICVFVTLIIYTIPVIFIYRSYHILKN